MTRHFDTRSMQFFITQPGACPYLPGREERKVFTHLDGLTGPGMVDAMTRAGFRRSQNVVYRPACEYCDACQSARVPVARFQPSRTQRRVMRANADLMIDEAPAQPTPEQFALLQRYLARRHAGGGMTDMDWGDYAAMVEGGWARTRIFEYRLPLADGAAGRLVGAALTDLVGDGVSMVYSFFDPDLTQRSLGAFMILSHIARTRAAGRPYVYLGYWVRGSDKMGYKALYQPLEVLRPDGWAALPDGK